MGDTIVLVHGTFAAEAEWAKDNGSLAQELRQRIPGVRVRSFGWSGANSHKARLAAGQDLDDFLISIPWHEQPIHLITHSHGGNVALYAARDSKTLLASISFLGTPFLNARVRDFESIISGLSIISLFLAFPIFVWISITVLIPFFPENAEASFIYAAMLLLLLVGSPVIALGIWLQVVTMLVMPRLRSWCLSFQRRTHAALSVQDCPCPVFVATVHRDEAALLLSVVDRIAALPWSFGKQIGQFLRGAGTTQALWLLISAGLAAFLPDEQLANALEASSIATFTALAFMALASFLLPIPAAALSTLIRGNRGAFGGEGPLFAMTMRVWPTVLPSWSLPAGSVVESYDAPASRSGWRHCSFYEDQAVIEAMAQWLSGLILRTRISAAPIKRPADGPQNRDAGFVETLGCLIWLGVCALWTVALWQSSSSPFYQHIVDFVSACFGMT